MLQASVVSSSRFPGRGMRGWCTGSPALLTKLLLESKLLLTALLLGTSPMSAGRST